MSLSYRNGGIIHREETDKGIVKWFEETTGGTLSCNSYMTEWGEKEDIKQCPKCDEFHNAHEPRLCHGCAFGMK